MGNKGKFGQHLSPTGSRSKFLISAEPPSLTGPILHRLHSLQFQTRRNRLVSSWNASQNDQRSFNTPEITFSHLVAVIKLSPFIHLGWRRNRPLLQVVKCVQFNFPAVCNGNCKKKPFCFINVPGREDLGRS